MPRPLPFLERLAICRIGCTDIGAATTPAKM
jgi:hypothetical protein